MTSSYADGSHVFLEHVHPLWKHGAGGTPLPSATLDGTPAEIVKGKLRGKFEWAFSFPFPSQFPYFGKRKDSETTLCTTPQTLMERTVHATIIYEVIVKVVAGLFRNKHKFVVHPIYRFISMNLCRDQDHRKCSLCALARQSGIPNLTERSISYRAVSVQSFRRSRGLVGLETSPDLYLH